MARPNSDAKAGYYPLSTEHLPGLASLITPGTGKILDPCAGEGTALQHLATAWTLTPYANELNHDRAASCRDKFKALNAVQGDLRELRASKHAFSVLYCNPPYSHDATETRPDKRTELALLKASWKWLQVEGVALWVVYDYHLRDNPYALKFFAAHCSTVDVYKLPGLHLRNYQQIVVVGCKLHPTAVTYDDLETRTAALTAKVDDAPDLVVHAKPVYQLPDPPNMQQFRFAPAKLTPDFALQAIQENGVHSSGRYQKLIAPPPPETLERPITLPKAAQVLMLIVSGFTNGITLPMNDGRTVMVRGTIQKTRALSDEEEILDATTGNVVGRKQTFTTRPCSVVTLLDTQGHVETLDTEADVVQFVEDHREALFAYIKTHHEPLYTFDYGGIKPLLDGVRLPLGNELKPLFTTQKHIIAASYTALQHRKRVLVAGEPGIGKTAQGLTLAAAIGKARKPGQVALVMCPPQLTKKWKREIERAHGLPPRYADILTRVDDVRQFMNRAEKHPDVLHIGVISREMAKLSSGWTHALHWQRQSVALWPQDTPPPPEYEGRKRIATQYIPRCPTCSTPVTASQKGETLTPGYFGYDPKTKTYGKGTRKQYTCRACGEALWQVERLKGSRPGKGEKFPKRNPRMALAEYIKMVFPRRIALAIVDEVHEAKSLSSDQGRAMTHLVNCADKAVGLTGTLFGGVASSMYLLLFMFSRNVRRHYPFGQGGMSDFIDAMGVLEETVEDRPQYENGVYSGTKRYESGAKESPGCSPRLVVETLPTAVFAGLQDIGIQMPELNETPVPVAMDTPLKTALKMGERKLKDYLLELRYNGGMWTFMGAYLQALMNYPDAAHQAYPVYHKEHEHTVWTFPALGPDRIAPKEAKLLELVTQELAEGRRVAVFVRQSGTRDIQRRLARLIRDQVPGANPYIMYGGNSGKSGADDGIASANVPTARREAAIEQVLENRHNVLLCNPLLVQTGLDLLEFSSLIFYEILFSLYPVDQASRRHWRIIQKQECRTFYLYYEGTMEERALEVLAKKREAAALLYGDMSADGLAALTGEGGVANDLVKALGQVIKADDTTTSTAETSDLQELFARTSLANYESPWTLAVKAEGVQAAGEKLPVVIDQPQPVPIPEPVVVKQPKPTPKPRPKPLPLVPMQPIPAGEQLSLF